MMKRSPFKYFKTSPEIIRLAVMLYVRLRTRHYQQRDVTGSRAEDAS